MLIFSGLTFVVEKDANPDEFISMPAALYWSIITMTSVGYGDITPRYHYLVWQSIFHNSMNSSVKL